MLIASKIDVFAHQLLEMRANGRIVPTLTKGPKLTLDDAYAIARRIVDLRREMGETPIGRKIGFNVKKPSNIYGSDDKREPIWAPIYDTTVHFATDNHGSLSLKGAQQPCIEPEIVFKLGQTPTADATVEELADCIEWMAHGVEIASCPFTNWKYTIPDAIAAFGLHGALIIGDQRSLSLETRHNLPKILARASLSLSSLSSVDGGLKAAGFCNDEIDSPLHALWRLHRLLHNQTLFPPLQAGEIISTGTWTTPYPIASHQTWVTAFSGVFLQGLTIDFVD